MHTQLLGTVVQLYPPGVLYCTTEKVHPQNMQKPVPYGDHPPYVEGFWYQQKG